MFVLWLLVVPVVWAAVFRFRRRRMRALAALVPPAGAELPVIGIAHKLVGTTEDIMASLKEFSYVAINEGGMMRGWLCHILYVLAVDPVDLEVILKTCLEKDDLHRFIRKIVGFGGIFAPVSIWRRRRKILVPAFSPKIVESFVPIFAKQSKILCDKLGEKADKEKISLWPFLCSFTLDSVCETALGVNINAQADSNSPFLVELNKLLQLICERIFHLWLQPEWLYKLFPQYKDHERGRKTLHKFTDEVILTKRKEIQEEKAARTEADYEYDLASYSTKTFLDHLIHFSGGDKGYSNEELREEVLTITIAATDTSANATGYTFQMLAKYPDIQDKVLRELDEIFGDSDRPFEKEDLQRLEYMDRVIKETLRLFPPVPFIIRKVEHELTLPSGRVLPAGAGVVVSIWGAHRDPRYWGPDAERFDPDRFLPGRHHLEHPCSFMPFSNGPRNCVGYRYAMMSIKTALSSVLRRHRVATDREPSAAPHVRVKLDIMMKAVDGYEIALQRRQPQC